MDDVIQETSAGMVLLRPHEGELQALVMRVRPHGFELPKGHVELDETFAQTAVRELQEETGLITYPSVGPMLPTVNYRFTRGPRTYEKRVFYFAGWPENGTPLKFGRVPGNVQELRWITEAEVEDMPWISDEIQEVVRAGFAAFAKYHP